MQNYEVSRSELESRFKALKAEHPERFQRRLEMSWSNWGFGLEGLERSCARLADAGLHFIELHGNHYGPALGYGIEQTLQILQKNDLRCSGVCGMFAIENDLASARPQQQQEAISYIRREAEFARAVGGEYLLVVPAAVGRADEYDKFESQRSAAALRSVADVFIETGIKAAIEPIRRDETTLVHTVAEAAEYIEAVSHPGVRHINGDVYHMQSGERNIADAILEAGDMLVNLHLADSNRRALGSGSMDLDAIIMALYVIGHNVVGRFVTPEPLGPGASPYAARNGVTDPEVLDALVFDSVSYFKSREDAVLAL